MTGAVEVVDLTISQTILFATNAKLLKINLSCKRLAHSKDSSPNLKVKEIIRNSRTTGAVAVVD